MKPLSSSTGSSPTAGGLNARQYVAPIVNMQHIKAGEHFVQFYESEQYLAQSVGAYLAQALSEEDSTIVIASKEHRAAFEAKLIGSGVDLEGMRANGRYVAFDAEMTLSRFMIDNQPDHRRVRAVLGPLIEVAADASPRGGVKIYGEMVALLWAAGNKVATVELEILWNELAEIYSFTLMCGYPIAAFNDAERSTQLRHICRAHSQVIPHEGYCNSSASGN